MSKPNSMISILSQEMLQRTSTEPVMSPYAIEHFKNLLEELLFPFFKLTTWG